MHSTEERLYLFIYRNKYISSVLNAFLLEGWWWGCGEAWWWVVGALI